MDLDFTEEQQMLRATVRDLMGRYSTPETVRELEDDPTGFRRDLWTALARTDLLGLTVAEEHGGAGQTALETAIVCEEMGRALCASPYIASSVLAPRVLPAEWGPRICTGESIVTVAWPEPDAGYGRESLRMRGPRLTGEKMLVPFASSADAIVTVTADGPYLVDTKSVTMTQELTMAADAQYLVAYSDAEGTPLGDWAAWEDALTDGLIAVAAYAIGGAARAHEMAVAYARERVQFGKPIGAFQAIAHPLADTITEVEGGRTLVHQAAWARAQGRDAATPAAMAKLYACDVFRRTTKLGQQIYGGIGFTRDIDMQLYFRRAKQLEVMWGDPAFLTERVAAAELDAERPFVSIDAGID